MKEATSWRELLKQIISDTKERQRIANELGISMITLYRWANHESNPRPQKLRQLITILPDQRQELEISMRQEFPDLGDSLDNLQEEIPSAFYERILRELASAQKPHSLDLIRLILLQIVTHIDINRQGMSTIFAKCMPPDLGNKIRSLVNVVQEASLPLRADNDLFFLGIESLGGHAVTSGRLILNQDLLEGYGKNITQQNDYENSAVAYPLMRAYRVAGCLILSSTQKNYFSTPRLSLLKAYGDLIAITLRDNDFYALDLISLLQMPSYPVQKEVFRDFRQHVSDHIVAAQDKNEPLIEQEAELLELKEVETQLLRRSAEKLER